ncbi:MAG: hypothetical protein ACK5QW_01825 [Cyanobacteriota bacterium]|jgi:hypothetical protein
MVECLTFPSPRAPLALSAVQANGASPLLGVVLWLLIVIVPFSPGPINAHPLAHSRVEAQPSPTPFLRRGMVMITVSLLAREDRLAPLGLPPDPHRAIAFATVVVRLDNQRPSPQAVTLHAIEIRGEPQHHLEPFAFTPRIIDLKPLERAVVDIHLSMRTGFLAQGPVKAIVRYQLEQEPEVSVASEAVPIERQGGSL